ncbi:MAG: diguanylate cyclase [Rhizobiales bacterium]|nr:diguanylate cyclase [Hyphomicrobiales bacterium]
MTDRKPAGREWAEALKFAAAGVAIAIALSLALTYLLLFSDGIGAFGRGVALSIALPLLIGGPAFFAIGWQRAQARELCQRLTRLATYDGLTDCFNPRAFSSIVERRRESALGPGRGAFLVVDAGQVRAVDRRYGIDWGEEALRLIAGAIRKSVRASDLVGRTSQNEFGVYLAGASEDDARAVGERIRDAVAEVWFAPGDRRDMLAVNVAGVVFEQELEFAEMMRQAARALPARGRARTVRLAHVPPTPAEMLRADTPRNDG